MDNLVGKTNRLGASINTQTRIADVRNLQVDLLVGEQAYVLLREAQFLAVWKSLSDRCAHATGFQSPAFVRAWYESYESIYEPVVVRSARENGELLGLWLLALDHTQHELVHAGAHQAEYQVWLALPGWDSSFLESAWTELQRRLLFGFLRFKYLPAASLADTLGAVAGMKGRIAVRLHSRPLLKLDPAKIKTSFAKKSNKSRFNRLRKLGSLEFRRLTEPEQLDQVIDDLIVSYDFRQGAVHHTTPFCDDPLKRGFHKAVFAAAPHEINLTVTYLCGRAIAALWGTMSGKVVHLGIFAYSPLLAEHSPGKLHVMQLSAYLLQEGMENLDLTLGGDHWKERFANAHDVVAEVILGATVALSISTIQSSATEQRGIAYDLERADALKLSEATSAKCSARSSEFPTKVSSNRKS